MHNSVKPAPVQRDIPQRWTACGGDAQSFRFDFDVLQNLVNGCDEGEGEGEGEGAHLATAVRPDQREHPKDTGDRRDPHVMRW